MDTKDNRPWKDYTKEEKEFLKGLAELGTNYHVNIGRVKKLAGIVMIHLATIDHAHMQACMS